MTNRGTSEGIDTTDLLDDAMTLGEYREMVERCWQIEDQRRRKHLLERILEHLSDDPHPNDGGSWESHILRKDIKDELDRWRIHSSNNERTRSEGVE